MFEITANDAEVSLAGTLSLDNLVAALETSNTQLDFEHTINLDLNGLEILDSAILSYLMHLKRACQAKGGDLQLVNVPIRLQKLTNLAGVSQILEIQPES